LLTIATKSAHIQYAHVQCVQHNTCQALVPTRLHRPAVCLLIENIPRYTPISPHSYPFKGPLHTLSHLIYHSIWFAFLYSHISLFTSYITHISTFAFPSILRSVCLHMVPYSTIRAMCFHIYPDIPPYPFTPIPLRC